MKRMLVLTVAILIVGSVMSLTAETMAYDSEKAVAIMRQNLGAMRPLGGTLESGNYVASGASFLTLAQGSMGLLAMTPPKGSEAEWVRVNTSLVKAALAGAEACLDKDKQAAEEALGQIRALNKEGHSNFR